MAMTEPMDQVDGEDILGVVQAPTRHSVYGLLVPSPNIEDFEIIATADPTRVIIAIPWAEMPSVDDENPSRGKWQAALEGVFMKSAAALGGWLERNPDHGAS